MHKTKWLMLLLSSWFAQAGLATVTDLKIVAASGSGSFTPYVGAADGYGLALLRNWAANQQWQVTLLQHGSVATALNQLPNKPCYVALLATTELVALQQQYRHLTFTAIGASAAVLGKNSLPPVYMAYYSQQGCGGVDYTANIPALPLMLGFYQQNFATDPSTQASFSKARLQRLPKLWWHFRWNALRYRLDYKMLVAQGFQESYLRSDVTSPTGVKGVMMLTQDTADLLGVGDRTHPRHSIKGGAKYLRVQLDDFADSPMPDRLWLALAAYNMGPNAVKRIQANLRASNIDPNQWQAVYSYMAARPRQGQYQQAMDYVTRIRSFYEQMVHKPLDQKKIPSNIGDALPEW